MKIIILAGGGGSRLFPLSRKSYPKQFLKLEDENNVAASNITSRKSGAAYLRDLAQYFGMVAEAE